MNIVKKHWWYLSASTGSESQSNLGLVFSGYSPMGGNYITYYNGITTSDKSLIVTIKNVK